MSVCTARAAASNSAGVGGRFAQFAALHQVDHEVPHPHGDDEDAPLDDGCDDAETQEFTSYSSLPARQGVESQKGGDHQQPGNERDEIHPVRQDRPIAQGLHRGTEVGLIYRVDESVPRHEYWSHEGHNHASYQCNSRVFDCHNCPFHQVFWRRLQESMRQRAKLRVESYHPSATLIKCGDRYSPHRL